MPRSQRVRAWSNDIVWRSPRRSRRTSLGGRALTMWTEFARKLISRCCGATLALLSTSSPGGDISGVAVNGAISEVLAGLGKETWEYSAGGGYVFRYSKDLVGDEAPETILNMTVQPDVWHIFSNGADGRRIGSVQMAGIATIGGDKEGRRTVFRRNHTAKNYDNPPFKAFGKYVIDTIISEEGVEQRIRTVGEDATQGEYLELMARQDLGETSIKFTSLQNFLESGEPSWKEYHWNQWSLSGGYYIHEDDFERAKKIRNSADEDKIRELVGDFTLEAARELLGRRGSGRAGDDESPAVGIDPESPTPADFEADGRIPWFLIGGIFAMGVGAVFAAVKFWRRSRS